MWFVYFVLSEKFPTNLCHVVPDGEVHDTEACACNPDILPVRAEGNVVVSYQYVHHVLA